MATIKRLNVTSCELLRRGTSASGRDWEMFEVFAVDDAGLPIEAKLRAFDPLPLNELRDYEITKREDERHGTSYTLGFPKGQRPQTAKQQTKDFKTQIADLKLQVANLEQKFEWLVGRLNALEHAGGKELSVPTPGPQSGPKAPEGAGSPPGSSAGAGSGALSQDDIPF